MRFAVQWRRQSGGPLAATLYSLLETAKLNGGNPQPCLANVRDRIGKGHPINWIDELQPWQRPVERGKVLYLVKAPALRSTCLANAHLISRGLALSWHE